MFTIIMLMSIGLWLANKYLPHLIQGVYKDPILPALIFTTGITSVITGYKSKASPILSSKLELGKLEISNLVAQVFSTSIMILWVWLYPSIWALATAGLTSALMTTILSYWLFPYRHQYYVEIFVSLMEEDIDYIVFRYQVNQFDFPL